MNYRELAKIKASSAEEIIADIENKKINISRLAKKTGVSRGTIYKIINGTLPTLKTINKIKDFLKNEQRR